MKFVINSVGCLLDHKLVFLFLLNFDLIILHLYFDLAINHAKIYCSLVIMIIITFSINP